MKKTLIGGFVGGLIIFFWQAFSQMAFNLHEPAQKYSSNQDSVLIALSKHLKEPGGYMLPRMKEMLSMEEMDKFNQSIQGKPWAIVRYYPSYQVGMGSNMLRNLIVDIFLVVLLIWIISNLKSPSKGLIIRLSLVMGFFAFTNVVYTEHIWYPLYDIRASLIDALVSWGLCGTWLGYWMTRKN